MNIEIGVMQGRLSPKYNGRYQAHPVGNWQREFPLAKELGLDLIEFILDFDGADKNPLLTQSGRLEILEQIDLTGIRVQTICADYFMEAPLHCGDRKSVGDSLKILEQLLIGAAKIGATDVVIPCVDQSSLITEQMKDTFVSAIAPLFEILNDLNVNLSLETDLNPSEFLAFLSRFECPHITVNYDTGNSSSLGYDPVEELSSYGNRITDVHIKDRLFRGGSVMLGTGDANLKSFFSKLKEINYRGPFILQAYRDDEGLEVFKMQLTWIKSFMDIWYAC